MTFVRSILAIAMLIAWPSAAFAQSVTGGTSEIANFRFTPAEKRSFSSTTPGVVGMMEGGYVFSRSSKNYAGNAYIFSVRNDTKQAVCVTFTFEHHGDYPGYESDSIAVVAPPKSNLRRFAARFDRASSSDSNVSDIRKVVMTVTDDTSACQ